MKEVEEILRAARQSRKTHMMTFQNRFIPAVIRAKQMIQSGFIGSPISFRSAYLHSGYVDPNRPITWRLERSKSGGGALADLGSHVIDLIRFLLGDFKKVFCTKGTLVKERPLPGNPGVKQEVDVEDYAFLLLELENGSHGTLEASRVATGSNDDMKIEIHGTQGAISFDLMNPNWLFAYDARDEAGPYGGNRGFKRIESIQAYPNPPAIILAQKSSFGWTRSHIASQYELIKALASDTPAKPDFTDGYQTQKTIEAAYKSAEKETWVAINE